MQFSRQHKGPVVLTLSLTEKSAKVGSAIVRDYMETTLFAIRDRLRSYGNQPY